MALRTDDSRLGMESHRCDVDDIRDFLINYAMNNCRMNVLSDDGQLKVTIKCFMQWHEDKYGIKATSQCKRAFSLYLPIVADEFGFKVMRCNTGRYLLIPFNDNTM